MIDKLKIEIAKRILSDVGILPHPHFGKAGITESYLLLKETIRIQDEANNKKELCIWAGEQIIGKDTFQGLVVNPEQNEFIFIFRLLNLPLYAIKLDWQDEPGCKFIIDYNKSSWQETGVLLQANALVGIEQLNNLGVPWLPCNDYTDLLKAVELVLEY